jgi:hypothetical protein
MDLDNQSLAPIRSALFVDFDNIFIGLSKTDPQAAERFAADPARWLSWLERGMPNHSGPKADQLRPRSILIRRCYPNPDAGFRRFRSFYTSAAFSVIDCPSMTRAGKNSSDIYMVMDILDTLDHKTHFDEFIIFSGDSDFMPVLLRLRAHDRRTTTLAIDFMPPAYKAACDLVISEEDFIEDALGVTHEGGSGRARVSLNLLKEMALRVYEATCQTGEVDGSDLPDILKDFREFRDSNNWLGFGLSQRLAEALVAAEPRLHLIRLSTTMYKLVIKTQVAKPGGKEKAADRPAADRPSSDRWSSDRPASDRSSADRSAGDRGDRSASDKQSGEKSHAAEKARPDKPPADKPSVEKPAGDRPAEKPGKSGKGSEKQGKPDLVKLRGQILALVKEMVAASPNPVLLARVSQQIVTKLGPQVLDTQWAGAGSFKKLIQAASDQGLEISTQPEPGYLFDPQRHNHPAQGGPEAPGGPETVPPVVHQAPQPGELSQAPGNGQADSEKSGKPAGFSPEQEAPFAEEGVPQPEDEAPEAVMSILTPVQTGSYEEDEIPDEYLVEEDTEPEEDYSDEPPPTMEEFIRRVSQVTGAPDLTPEQYGLVFRGIVHELQLIAAGEKNYTTYQSSKSVSDWCAAHGSPVSRSDVVLVFKGIIFQDGVRFGKQPGSYTERELAELVANNIRALCKRSQLELSEYEDHVLDEWIMGQLDDEPVSEEPFQPARPVEEETFLEEPPSGVTWSEHSEPESAWGHPSIGELDPGLLPDAAPDKDDEQPPADREGQGDSGDLPESGEN